MPVRVEVSSSAELWVLSSDSRLKTQNSKLEPIYLGESSVVSFQFSVEDVGAEPFVRASRGVTDCATRFCSRAGARLMTDD